jgi:hypothetical protein
LNAGIPSKPARRRKAYPSQVSHSMNAASTSATAPILAI